VIDDREMDEIGKEMKNIRFVEEMKDMREKGVDGE